MSTPIPEWKRGDANKADRHNLPIRRLNSIGEVTGGRGVNVRSGNGATVISLPSGKTPLNGWWARIVSAPAGKTDHADERYWVEEIVIKASGDHESAPEFEATPAVRGLYEEQNGDNVRPLTAVVAINLPEVEDHTHDLEVGDVVFIWDTLEANTDDSEIGEGNTAVVRYAFSVVPSMGRGQYQGEKPQMVSDWQVGWDFTKAAPIP
jgi:hypothetical protein